MQFSKPLKSNFFGVKQFNVKHALGFSIQGNRTENCKEKIRKPVARHGRACPGHLRILFRSKVRRGCPAP
jgi:hypothetical protein